MVFKVSNKSILEFLDDLCKSVQRCTIECVNKSWFIYPLILPIGLAPSVVWIKYFRYYIIPLKNWNHALHFILTRVNFWVLQQFSNFYKKIWRVVVVVVALKKMLWWGTLKMSWNKRLWKNLSVWLKRKAY